MDDPFDYLNEDSEEESSISSQNSSNSASILFQDCEQTFKKEDPAELDEQQEGEEGLSF